MPERFYYLAETMPKNVLVYKLLNILIY